MAFMLERALPAGVTGPVLNCALARLASSLASEMDIAEPPV
jgi:hypothetical protein